MYSYGNEDKKLGQERLKSFIRSPYAVKEEEPIIEQSYDDEKAFDEILTNSANEFKGEENYYATTVESDDLKPSVETLAHTGEYKSGYYKNQYKSDVESITESYKLSGKGKIVIAIYSLLLVLVFALIIFNAKYLRGMDNKIQNTQQEVVKITQEVEEVKAKLEEASSDETIISKAKEFLNMVES